jgi:hypothetical protein
MLSQPQGHSAAGWIRSTEKSNDLIGNRTRDIPACSIVPQPTMLPRAPVTITMNKSHETECACWDAIRQWVQNEWFQCLIAAWWWWWYYHQIGRWNWATNSNDTDVVLCVLCIIHTGREIPWSRVLTEKLTVAQLVKRPPGILWNPNINYRIHKSLPFQKISSFKLWILSRIHQFANFPLRERWVGMKVLILLHSASALEFRRHKYLNQPVPYAINTKYSFLRILCRTVSIFRIYLIPDVSIMTCKERGKDPTQLSPSERASLDQ